MLSFGPLKGRLHPAGIPFVAVAGVVAFVAFFVSTALGVVGGLLMLCVAAFFREPHRVAFKDDSVLLSPADGLLVGIEKAVPPQEIGMYQEGDWVRLSIFLSVFDVHVNRMPQKGRVLMTAYHKGQFFNASLDKASALNERNSVVLETSRATVVITQIAGLLARRIVCGVSIGDMVKAGETFGIIRFGSRVDLYVPAEAHVEVLKGQRMVGGETVVARFSPKRKTASGK